jgi:hypothetical protein
LRDIPPTAPTLRWMPEHGDLVYTLGGAAPKHRITSGTRIVSWTEDCFDGFVKTASDFPSKVMPPGHDNPQTGPFHVEGAESGGSGIHSARENREAARGGKAVMRRLLYNAPMTLHRRRNNMITIAARPAGHHRSPAALT